MWVFSPIGQNRRFVNVNLDLERHPAHNRPVASITLLEQDVHPPATEARGHYLYESNATKPRNPPAMPFDLTIRARYSLHLERLRSANERMNAGEVLDGLADLEDAAAIACGAAIESSTLRACRGSSSTSGSANRKMKSPRGTM